MFQKCFNTHYLTGACLCMGMQMRRRSFKNVILVVGYDQYQFSGPWNEVIKWIGRFLFIVLLLYYCRYAAPTLIWWHGRELGGETTWGGAASTGAWAGTRHQHSEGHDGTAQVAATSCYAQRCMVHQHFLLRCFIFDSYIMVFYCFAN